MPCEWALICNERDRYWSDPSLQSLVKGQDSHKSLLPLFSGLEESSKEGNEVQSGDEEASLIGSGALLTTARDLIGASAHWLDVYEQMSTLLSTIGQNGKKTEQHIDFHEEHEQLGSILQKQGQNVGQEIHAILDVEQQSSPKKPPQSDTDQVFWNKFTASVHEGKGKENQVEKAGDWLVGMNKAEKAIAYLADYLTE